MQLANTVTSYVTDESPLRLENSRLRQRVHELETGLQEANGAVAVGRAGGSGRVEVEVQGLLGVAVQELSEEREKVEQEVSRLQARERTAQVEADGLEETVQQHQLVQREVTRLRDVLVVLYRLLQPPGLARLLEHRLLHPPAILLRLQALLLSLLRLRRHCRLAALSAAGAPPPPPEPVSPDWLEQGEENAAVLGLDHPPPRAGAGVAAEAERLRGGVRQLAASMQALAGAEASGGASPARPPPLQGSPAGPPQIQEGSRRGAQEGARQLVRVARRAHSEASQTLSDLEDLQAALAAARPAARARQAEVEAVRRRLEAAVRAAKGVQAECGMRGGVLEALRGPGDPRAREAECGMRGGALEALRGPGDPRAREAAVVLACRALLAAATHRAALRATLQAARELGEPQAVPPGSHTAARGGQLGDRKPLLQLEARPAQQSAGGGGSAQAPPPPASPPPSPVPFYPHSPEASLGAPPSPLSCDRPQLSASQGFAVLAQQRAEVAEARLQEARAEIARRQEALDRSQSIISALQREVNDLRSEQAMQQEQPEEMEYNQPYSASASDWISQLPNTLRDNPDLKAAYYRVYIIMRERHRAQKKLEDMEARLAANVGSHE